MANRSNIRVGVLALQGDFERHAHQLGLTGTKSVLVRKPEHLADIDALIIPGGESTTMEHLIDRFHLREPILKSSRGKAIWGTCAGMILLAKRVDGDQARIKPLGLMDIDVVRMGYGRQVFSFEHPITATFDSGPVTLSATFIRAPRVTRVGDSVQTLAHYQDSPVLLTNGIVMASSFHTELDDDVTLLEFFLNRYVRKKC